MHIVLGFMLQVPLGRQKASAYSNNLVRHQKQDIYLRVSIYYLFSLHYTGWASQGQVPHHTRHCSTQHHRQASLQPLEAL